MTKDINKEAFDDSTKLKLEIFGKCFREWLPVFIYNPSIKKIFIYDFFAGSGVDTLGNLGSPLILLQKARGGEEKSYCGKIKKPIQFVFNEVMQSKVKLLKNSVENYISTCEEDNGCRHCVYHTDIKNDHFKNGFYATDVQNILQTEDYGKFVLLDQYGFKHIDKRVFLDLVNSQKTDFIFFISSSFIKRFKEEQSTKAYIDTRKINFENSSSQECHRIIADYFRSLIDTPR